VHGQAERPLDERAVQVQLEALGGAEERFLPESSVEAGTKLWLLSNHREPVREDLGRRGEVVCSNEDVDVAEQPPGGLRVREMGQRHSFKDASLDSGGGQKVDCLEDQVFEPECVSEPGL
jgi:hypothetical protein